MVMLFNQYVLSDYTFFGGKSPFLSDRRIETWYDYINW